ncbi:MAG: DUF1573 domain-containing protein [Bacteroidetes bacterium]|nr:DUF1573 domain-containing protein [Bacteroidota bacterium]
MKNIVATILIAAMIAFASEAVAQRNVVSSDGTLHDKFSKKLGNLMFSTTTLKYGKLKNNVTKSDTIKIYNAGNKTLNVSVGKVPAHLSINLKSSVIDPNTESWIAIVFDATRKNDYGFVLDRFELVTNDSVLPKKGLSVTAAIEEAFTLNNADDSAQAAKARWRETVFDYGKAKPGDKMVHDFIFYNDGKKDLVIHKTKSTCGCLKATLSKYTVAAGDSSAVHIEFDSFGKDGKDSRKLFVYLSDFQKPEVTIEIKGELVK